MPTDDAPRQPARPPYILPTRRVEQVGTFFVDGLEECGP